MRKTKAIPVLAQVVGHEQPIDPTQILASQWLAFFKWPTCLKIGLSNVTTRMTPNPSTLGFSLETSTQLVKKSDVETIFSSMAVWPAVLCYGAMPLSNMLSAMPGQLWWEKNGRCWLTRPWVTSSWPCPKFSWAGADPCSLISLIPFLSCPP